MAFLLFFFKISTLVIQWKKIRKWAPVSAHFELKKHIGQGKRSPTEEKKPKWMASGLALHFPVGLQVLLPVVMKLANNS